MFLKKVFIILFFNLIYVSALPLPQFGGDGRSDCMIKEKGGKEYKYTVDTCQFLGQFGLNSIVHGAVLGKEPGGKIDLGTVEVENENIV